MTKKRTKKRYALAIIIALALVLIGCFYAPMRIPYFLLPAKAKTFVGSHFPAAGCVYAERDYDDGRMEYEVKLSDGVDLEFTSSGEWLCVDCGYSSVPAGIVPAPIETDVRTRFPNTGIYSIERARGGYEVKVGNGMELIYSADGNFVRIDY